MNSSISSMCSFAFFGTCGLTLASVGCSASSVGSAPTGSSGSGNTVIGSTGGSNYVVGAGGAGTAGSGNAITSDVLQPDGTFLLQGIVRDFHTAFPDMEPCSHDSNKLCDIGGANIEQNYTASDTTRDCTTAQTINKVSYPSTCIVATTLDAATGKPAYAGPAGGTITTTGKDNFDWWFKTDPAGNINAEPASPIPLVLVPTGDGRTFAFDSTAFFPIDNQLFGNEGDAHNFHFTTEFHLKFTYQKGQEFYFKGDDDLWVFIDGNLVVDRGGIHNAREATLKLDDLGFANESDHQFDLFYCERHTTLSDLKITTSMKFTASVVVN
jgi:fibro-slime domain-containing protein